MRWVMNLGTHTTHPHHLTLALCAFWSTIPCRGKQATTSPFSALKIAGHGHGQQTAGSGSNLEHTVVLSSSRANAHHIHTSNPLTPLVRKLELQSIPRLYTTTPRLRDMTVVAHPCEASKFILGTQPSETPRPILGLNLGGQEATHRLLPPALHAVLNWVWCSPSLFPLCPFFPWSSCCGLKPWRKDNLLRAEARLGVLAQRDNRRRERRPEGQKMKWARPRHKWKWARSLFCSKFFTTAKKMLRWVRMFF